MFQIHDLVKHFDLRDFSGLLVADAIRNICILTSHQNINQPSENV